MSDRQIFCGEHVSNGTSNFIMLPNEMVMGFSGFIQWIGLQRRGIPQQLPKQVEDNFTRVATIIQISKYSCMLSEVTRGSAAIARHSELGTREYERQREMKDLAVGTRHSKLGLT